MLKKNCTTLKRAQNDINLLLNRWIGLQHFLGKSKLVGNGHLSKQFTVHSNSDQKLQNITIFVHQSIRVNTSNVRK